MFALLKPPAERAFAPAAWSVAMDPRAARTTARIPG